MTVMIRLTRTGRRNRACFRLVAIDKRNARDGRVLENLGLYDPVSPRVDDQLRLKGERIVYWVENGAQLSDTARSLCVRQGIELPKNASGIGRKKARTRSRKHSETKVKSKQARDARLQKAKKERRDARVAAKKAAAAAEASEES